MTNTHRKLNAANPTYAKGAATLFITVILVITAALIIVYTTTSGVLQQRTAGNLYIGNQAFEAAEAGLEYGIAYLNASPSTVTASITNGWINYSLGTTTLTNKSTFSVVYTNVSQNDFSLLQITSTGTSADGLSTSTVTEQVSSAGTVSLQYAVTTQQNLSANGNVSVLGNNGVDIGKNFIHNGNNNVPTINQDDTTLANTPGPTLFQNIFGITENTMESQSTYFNNPGIIPFSLLTGKVWIDGNVNIGTNTVGSPANPVLLIVNGNLNTQGNITIYGVVYVMGNTTAQGKFTVYGGLVSQGNVDLSGSTHIYNQPIIKTFAAGASYARVDGSWRDF